MPSAINKLMVAELSRKFREMPNALLVDFTGLSAVQADALRTRLREQGADMLVVKNTLAALALAEAGLRPVARLLTGPTAFVSSEDPVAVSKSLRDWGRKERVLTYRGAYVEGEVLGPEGVEALVALPPLLVLRAQVVGAIAAPLSCFIGALQGIVRGFVGVVKAIADKKEQEA